MGIKSRTQPTPSLRERKFARTKLGLLDATLRLLDSQPLDAVRVKDICQGAEVSEGSFFNYFPTKNDVLVYFIQLWSLEMAWHGRRLAERRGGLAAIEKIFALTAKRLLEQPQVMAEIIAFQARRSAPPVLAPLSLAERMLAFPDLEGIDTLEATELRSLLAPFVAQAVTAGELPEGIDVDATVLAIASVLFGVPVVLGLARRRQIGSTYRAQLHLLWAGLRRTATRENP